LEALLMRLEQWGVPRTVIEQPTPRLVAADRRMVAAVPGERLVGKGLGVETARPMEEPML
jgi:hypothetical protein